MNLKQTKQQIKSLERILDQMRNDLDNTDITWLQQARIVSAMHSIILTITDLEMLVTILTLEKKNQK